MKLITISIELKITLPKISEHLWEYGRDMQSLFVRFTHFKHIGILHKRFKFINQTVLYIIWPNSGKRSLGLLSVVL